MGTKSPPNNALASTSIRAAPAELLSALDLSTPGGLASFDALALSYADFLGFPSCDGFSELCNLLSAPDPPVICAPRQGSGFLSSKKALDPIELRNELRRNGVTLDGRESLNIFYGPTPAMMSLDTLYLAQSVHAILEDAKAKTPRLALTVTTLVEVDGDAVRAVLKQLEKGVDEGERPSLMQIFMDNGGHLVPCLRRSKPGMAWPKPIRMSILTGVPMGEFRWGNKGGAKGGRFDKTVTGYYAFLYYDLASTSETESDALFDTELTVIAEGVVGMAAASVREAMNKEDEWFHRRPDLIDDGEGELDRFNAFVIAPEEYALKARVAMGELVGALATSDGQVYCVSVPPNGNTGGKASVKSPASQAGGSTPRAGVEAKTGEGTADLASFMGDVGDERLRPDDLAGSVTFVKIDLQMALVSSFRALQISKLQNTFGEHANRGVCFGSDRFHLTATNDGSTYTTRLELILHNQAEVVTPLMAAKAESALRRAISAKVGDRVVIVAAMPTQTKYVSGLVCWLKFIDFRAMRSVFGDIFERDNRFKLALAPVFSHVTHGMNCYPLHPHLAVVTITSSRLNSNIQLAPEGLFAQWLRRLASLYISNLNGDETGGAPTNLSTFDAVKLAVDWTSICVVRDIKGVGKPNGTTGKAQLAVRLLCPNVTAFLKQVGRQIQSKEFLLTTALPDPKLGWGHYVDTVATARCCDGLQKLFESEKAGASLDPNNMGNNSATKCENMYAELSELVSRDEMEKEKKASKAAKQAKHVESSPTAADDETQADSRYRSGESSALIKATAGVIYDLGNDPSDCYLLKKYSFKVCNAFQMECQHIRIGDRAKELAGFSVDEESKCTTQEKRIAEADLKAGRSNDYRVAALLDLADIAIVNCPPRLSLCTIVQQLLSGGVYDLTEDVVTSTQRTIAGAYIEYIFDAFENVGVAEKSAQLVKVLGHESAWPLAREEWVQLNREGNFDKAVVSHEALAGLQWNSRSDGCAVFHFVVFDVMEESASFMLNPFYSQSGIAPTEYRLGAHGKHEMVLTGPVCIIVKDGFAYRLAVRKNDHPFFAAQYRLARLGVKRSLFLTRIADDEKSNKIELVRRSKENQKSWRCIPTPCRDRVNRSDVGAESSAYLGEPKRLDFNDISATAELHPHVPVSVSYGLADNILTASVDNTNANSSRVSKSGANDDNANRSLHESGEVCDEMGEAQ